MPKEHCTNSKCTKPSHTPAAKDSNRKRKLSHLQKDRRSRCTPAATPRVAAGGCTVQPLSNSLPPPRVALCSQPLPNSQLHSRRHARRCVASSQLHARRCATSSQFSTGGARRRGPYPRFIVAAGGCTVQPLSNSLPPPRVALCSQPLPNSQLHSRRHARRCVASSQLRARRCAASSQFSTGGAWRAASFQFSTGGARRHRRHDDV